jgi:predicted extracellular nuclease
VIVVGDFNANEFTDGYVDVTGTIAGTVDIDATHSIFPPTASYTAPNPTLINTVESTTDPTANPLTWNPNYSYSFDGLSEEIDHILLTRAGWADFVRISHSHGNSDVSSASADVSDATTPRRLSDHDGQVLTIAIDRIFADGFEAQP